MPLNDEVADTKLEKVENCGVIPYLKGLVHPEFSITEMDYQCEFANVKGNCYYYFTSFRTPLTSGIVRVLMKIIRITPPK